MAAATLINTGTPGPALALDPSAITAAMTGGTPSYVGASGVSGASPTPVTTTTVSLTTGLWLVLGIIYTDATDSHYPTAAYLNTAGAIAANSWPVQNSGSGGVSASPLVVAATIKLATTTTIYLNGTNPTAGGYTYQCYGVIYAVKIG